MTSGRYDAIGRTIPRWSLLSPRQPLGLLLAGHSRVFAPMMISGGDEKRNIHDQQTFCHGLACLSLDADTSHASYAAPKSQVRNFTLAFTFAPVITVLYDDYVSSCRARALFSMAMHARFIDYRCHYPPHDACMKMPYRYEFHYYLIRAKACHIKSAAKIPAYDTRVR